MLHNQNLLLQNGSFLDVESGAINNASILIKDGKIAKIFPEKSASFDHENHEAQIVDLQGKWILPGLIDMHVHIKEGFAPLFVASGVTTVRNTGGNVYELQKLREASLSAPTPRIVSADRIIDGPPGLWGDTSPWSVIIDDPVKAIEEVKRQVEAGADFIKVYGWLSKDIMTVVVQEAQKYNKEVSCDLVYSSAVNALDAARLGIKWNEHASGIMQAMYPHWHMKAGEDVWNEVRWDEPDHVLIELICRQLLEYDVVICPTMTFFDQIDHLPNYWYPKNKVTEKLEENLALVQQWSNLSQHVNGLRKMALQSTINKCIAKTYFDLGGTVVAGTDTPAGTWTLPGMALHRELELFVEAGFSEIDAIRTATNKAADALNLPYLGVIQEDAIADLLILNTNPLEDIRNTKDIHLVIKGGSVYHQTDILVQVPGDEYIHKTAEEFMNWYNNEPF